MNDEFDYESPFIREIHAVWLPANFKEPHMTPYEGNTDPKYHLDAFNDLMKLRGINSRARCHCFTLTLRELHTSGSRDLGQGPSGLGNNFLMNFSSNIT